MKVMTEYNKWLESAKDKEVLEELVAIKDDDAEIADRFYRPLAFGTGGLRGVIGAGTNRMNIYTVGRATTGLAEYMLKSGTVKKVAIAYDSRIKSQEFAFRAADILSAKGIEVYIFSELMPTPVLSYTVRKLGAGAGIVITASHNPKEYNGYKVYNEHGCQITDKAAAEILSEIEKADYFTEAKADKEKIHILGDDILNDFLKAIQQYRLNDCVNDSGIKIVYTPLHGTGNKPVRKLLAYMGVNVVVVKEQEEPDGNFTTCPYPNPEEKAAMSLAIACAEKENADLVMATDPDADRIGIAVKDGENGYKLLSGNETGGIIADYMLSQKTKRCELGARPTLIKTIVTTDMAFGIAKEYGAEVKEVLTGFKYIGEELDRTENFIMGFEESYGYLVGRHARDKDAVSAAMMIVEAVAYYKKQGRTLLGVLKELYKKYGYYKNELISVKYEGQQGMATMKEITDNIRNNPLSEIDSEKVEFTDFSVGVNGLPKSNVIRFRNDDIRVIVRPSGTEPKLKIYYQVKGTSEQDAELKLDRVKEYCSQTIFNI
nr:phospho-sugar mutase [Clostridia bacterium]